MYNKEMFQAKGLTMPERPTWAQVADFASKLDDKAAGTAGICLRGLPGWGEVFAPLTTVVNTYGGTWFDADWNAKVNSPEFTAATTFYVDLVKKYGEAGASQAGFTECLNTFGQGKAAMWYDATSAAGTLEDPAAGKVGYVCAPVNKTENAGWLRTWAWAMPKTTKKADNAWKFISWSTGKQYEKTVGEKRLARTGGNRADLLHLRLEQVLLRRQPHRHGGRDGPDLPGRVHLVRGPVPCPALCRGDPGLAAGAHRRLVRPEQARARSLHGSRQVKAVVIVEPGTIAIETVPDPAPGPDDVVVAVTAVGICGTDLHIMDGEFAPSYPIVPGHEFAGEIVGVGSAVTGYAVGDRVAVDPSLYCGYCYQCKRNRGNQCENWGAIGVSVSGGAAQFALSPMKNLYKLPTHLPAGDAALIEPLSCAVRGFDVLPRRMADNYLIYGSGTMGLMMMELAKRGGAATVSMVDVNPERLETAKLLGCTAAATSADELDAPRGWDVVIDCTGVEAAIKDGFARVGKGGTFLQFGVANYDARLSIEPYEIYRREITITGSMAVLNSFDRAGELLAGGVLRPDIFISHRFPLDDYVQALGQFRAGIGRKILIEP